MEFKAFQKIPRLKRGCIITEKIDGTNANIYVGEDGEFLVGSRTRWLDLTHDNFGFCQWATKNKEELLKLGPGHHFGEWWGVGIQRNYGLSERRFSLFNTSRYTPETPAPSCCSVVPVLYTGDFNTDSIEKTLTNLAIKGSFAEPGFMKPEGIVIYHQASRLMFKQTIENDSGGKNG